MALFNCVQCGILCPNYPLCSTCAEACPDLRYCADCSELAVECKCEETMTHPHDYAAALADMEACLTPSSIARGYSHVKGCEDKTVLAIRHALKVADRLMQEPSEEMLEKHEVALIECHPAEKGAYLCNAGDVFKAMRDQLLAEVGE